MEQTLVIEPASSKGVRVSVWALKLVLGAAFLAAGGAKLAGAPMMVEVFDQIGLGQWFRIVAGIVEVAGAVGLFIPGLTALAALGLSLVMVGAIAAHLVFLPTSGVPAAVLGALALALAYLRRDELARLRDRLR